MGKFLREYGVWIAAPIVIAVILLVAAFFLMGDGGLSDFVYNLW